MDPTTVLHIVQRAGMQARIKNDEVLIRDCVFCGNPRWNLELNGIKGVYGCWACRAGGKLENFLKRFANAKGIKIPVNLDASSQSQTDNQLLQLQRETKPADRVGSALRYILDRGLSLQDIHKHSIQVATDEDDPVYGRILIPVKEYWMGEHIGFVARAYYGNPPSKYLNLLDKREIVGFREGGRRGVHVLVEGVFDALMVNKAGFQAAALLGLLDGDTLEEWAAMAPPDDDIIVLVDGDAKDMGVKITTTINTFRNNTQLLILPGELDPAMLEPEVLKVFIQKALGE